jgi:hypothetical protein
LSKQSLAVFYVVSNQPEVKILRGHIKPARFIEPLLIHSYIQCTDSALSFRNLQSFLNANTGSKILSNLAGKDGPIEGCKRSMTALELLFPSDTSQTQGQQGSKKKRKLTAALATLAWPFKENKAKKSLEEISQHKSTISLVLATESL